MVFLDTLARLNLIYELRFKKQEKLDARSKKRLIVIHRDTAGSKQ